MSARVRSRRKSVSPSRRAASVAKMSIAPEAAAAETRPLCSQPLNSEVVAVAALASLVEAAQVVLLALPALLQG